MKFFRFALISILVLFVGMVLWMAYYFYFRTDQQGRVLREADSPAAAANGQRQLNRADALLASGAYVPARTLLDSLRDADLDPNTFIATEELMQRYDSLRAKQRRTSLTQ